MWARRMRWAWPQFSVSVAQIQHHLSTALQLPFKMDSEESSGLFGISEDLVQSPVHKATGVSSVDFDGLLSPPLRLQEDLSEGCGGQLWPAGMVLSKYMLRKHKDDIRDSSMFVRSTIMLSPTNIF